RASGFRIGELSPGGNNIQFGHSTVADDVPNCLGGRVDAAKSRSLAARPIGIDANVIACGSVAVGVRRGDGVFVQIGTSFFPNGVLQSLELFLPLFCALRGVDAYELDGFTRRIN